MGGTTIYSVTNWNISRMNPKCHPPFYIRAISQKLVWQQRRKNKKNRCLHSFSFVTLLLLLLSNVVSPAIFRSPSPFNMRKGRSGPRAIYRKRRRLNCASGSMEEGRPYLLHWWSLSIRLAWNGAVDKSNNTTARTVEEKLIEPRWIHADFSFRTSFCGNRRDLTKKEEEGDNRQCMRPRW